MSKFLQKFYKARRLLKDLQVYLIFQRQTATEIQMYDDSHQPTMSEFKRIFKYYKRRDHPLELSEVIDPSKPSSSKNIVSTYFDEKDLSCFEELSAKVQGLKPINQWSLISFSHKPGLFIISGMLTRSEQLRWIQRSLFNFPEPPNITNLHVQKDPYTGKDVFKSCGPDKLRWVTMGIDYKWDTKEYAEVGRSHLPDEMVDLAQLVTKILKLGPFHPDAAIVNYYPEKSQLSPHVDRSEHDLNRPLVSLSFGQTAIYLTGGTTLDDPVDALLLRSGDILVMSGAQRLVYHAVPRIVSECTFDGLEMDEQPDDSLLDYANQYRVNITVRQVENYESKD